MEQQMLKDKVTVITGASYGMGRTMAELFAEEGAAVVITARHQDQLDEVVEGIRAKGGKAVGVVADVCSTEDTKKVFDTALKEFGDVDILINNAGIGEQKLIDETDDDWMMYVMNTNLGGPMRYIREALKIFLPQNDGVIINVSSVNGTRPFCGATYTSTKGALNTLTKNVAMRLVDTNIRCNAIAPGATITPAHLANKAGEQPGGDKMLQYSGIIKTKCTFNVRILRYIIIIVIYLSIINALIYSSRSYQGIFIACSSTSFRTTITYIMQIIVL